MILVDANLLVYAFAASMPEHERTRTWLDEQLASGRQVGLPWESLNAFVRLVSNPRVFTKPASTMAAWGQVERWIGHPGVWIPVPTPHHAAVVEELIGQNDIAANDIPDVHLAALAISHGLRLASHDAGFGRYPGLRWFDPLAS